MKKDITLIAGEEKIELADYTHFKNLIHLKLNKNVFLISSGPCFFVSIAWKRKSMNWFGYVECVLIPTIIIVEIIAIATLYQNRNKKKNKHQIYIISALCICELNNALTVIVFYGLRFGRISKTLIVICFFYHLGFCRFT